MEGLLLKLMQLMRGPQLFEEKKEKMKEGEREEEEMTEEEEVKLNSREQKLKY